MPGTRCHRFLAVILAVSAALRVWLALEGGQFFFGDESRYERGIAIYQALRAGDTAALREILKWPRIWAASLGSTFRLTLSTATNCPGFCSAY